MYELQSKITSERELNYETLQDKHNTIQNQ